MDAISRELSCRKNRATSINNNASIIIPPDARKGAMQRSIRKKNRRYLFFDNGGNQFSRRYMKFGNYLPVALRALITVAGVASPLGWNRGQESALIVSDTTANSRDIWYLYFYCLTICFDFILTFLFILYIDLFILVIIVWCAQ